MFPLHLVAIQKLIYRIGCQKRLIKPTKGVWTRRLVANWWQLFAWPRAARATSAYQSVALKVGTGTFTLTSGTDTGTGIGTSTDTATCTVVCLAKG